MGSHLEKASLLIEQDRYDLAEKEVGAALAEDPESARAHALLALCRIRTGKRDEALAPAREAVRLAPDWGFPHFMLGKVHYAREEHDKALASLGEAIRLDPDEANYRWVIAAVLLDTGRTKEALAAADEGLRLEPEESGIHSMRGLVLYQLGRVGEAEEAYRRALSLDPRNDVAHAGLGRVAASRGHADAAVESFREALRIDPNDAWARQGLLEALRARYPVYGVFLRWLEWTRRLSGRTRTGLFIGLYFLFRMAGKSLRDAEGPLQWVLLLFVIVYILFFLMTWVADPLFNLLLRMRPEGRLLLTKEEIAASNLVGAALGASVLSGAAALVLHSIHMAVAAALFFVSVPALTMLFGIRRRYLRILAGTGFVLLLLFGLAGVAAMGTKESREWGIVLVVGAGAVLVLATWVSAISGLFRK